MNISPMLYQIANENNLKNAWVKISFHARTSLEYYDKYAYDEFEENLELNLAVIRHELLNQTYQFNKLRIFEIPKGEIDKRKVYFLTPKDGVVTQAIINVIAPIFEKHFSSHSYGNRISYANNESKNPFLDWYDQYTKYINHILSILELAPYYWYQITDITNYYPSIDKTKLLAKLAKNINGADILHLLEDLLNLQAINLNEQTENVPGLPPGTIYSHFLANLFLDDFDKFMENSTENYARYVDDMCFVVKSEEDLIDLNQKMADMLGHSGNLFLKEKKTESQPIYNPEPLIEHTRRLKYDLRFGVIETLKSASEFSEVQVTEKVFHDLFFRVEKEEEISKVVEYAAGFIAAGFRKLAIDSQVAISIAHGILSKKPQRVTAIRALLGYLMGVNIDNPSEEFIELITSSPDIIKISFLQLLLGYSEVSEQILNLLLDLKDQDENYLVRANVYMVLENLNYSFDNNNFRELATSEKSDYVLARLTQCISFGKQNENTWAELRQILENKSPLVLNSTIFALHKINYQKDNWEATHILLPIIIDHPSYGLYSSAFLLKLVSQFGNYEALRQVYEDLCNRNRDITDVLFKLSWATVLVYLAKRKNDYGKLFLYIDSLKRLSINIDYIYGYQEILINSQETSLVENARSLADKTDISALLPERYSKRWLQVDKGLYCEYLIEANYSCRLFQDGELRGVLETIPVDVILNSQKFNSVEEWIDYLKDLDKKDVIKLISKGVFMENGIEKVFAEYEIEPGFESISDWMKLDTVLFSEKMVVNILTKTADKMEQTKLINDFYFQNPSPCTVLWNPQGKIKLLNIGSALLIPKYVCGGETCNKKYHSEEVGKSTGGYFLGLLGVQMITNGECPVLNLDTSKKIRRKKSFYEANDITPHLKSVIARTVMSAAHRYKSLGLLKQDLSYIVDFIKKRDGVPKEKTRFLGKLTLVDYINFRLEISYRNPESPIDPLHKVSAILEGLSEQITYYTDKDTIKSLFDHRSKVPFTNPLLWHWLSPESRTLLELAFDWDDLIKALEKQIGIKYSNLFSKMLFGRVVYFESLATIQGLLTFSAQNKVNTKSFCDSLITVIHNENFSKLRIKASDDRFSQTLPNPYSAEDINPITNLFQFVEKNNWIVFLRRLSSKVIFSGINFSRHDVSFYFPNDSPAFMTKPLSKVNGFSSRTWLIHKLPFKFLENITSSADISIELFWKDVINLIIYLRAMNPCKRKRGKLTDYLAVAVPPQGNITFGWDWISWNPIEASFSEERVLSLGNLLVTQGKPKAIQVDMIDRTKKISTIYSYSKIFDALKPQSRINFESMVSTAMRRNKWFAWFLTISLSVVEYSLVFPDWKNFSLLKLLLGAAILVVTRLLIDPAWKGLENILAISKPEDKVFER